MLLKDIDTPPTGKWTKEMTACLPLEKLMSSVKKEKRTSPYIDFLETHDFK